jgi:hypothetical protein
MHGVGTEGADHQRRLARDDPRDDAGNVVVAQHRQSMS